MIDQIKTVGIIVLLIFTLISAGSTVFLIKTNTKLHSEIVTLQLKLDESENVVQTLRDQAKVTDDSLKQQIESGVKVDDAFQQINHDLADIKCKTTTQVRTHDVKGIVPSSDASDIADVAKLLDTAACTANSDCKPTGSSPSGL